MPGSEHTPAENPAILLASLSPRRRRLMAWLKLPYECTSVETPEDITSPLCAEPPALARHLAAEKARAVRSAGMERPGTLVACFDTIVVLDGEVLGKPKDTADAWRMLRALSGRTHQVVTGVALMCMAEEPTGFAVTTNVAMLELDDAAIEAWMAHGTYLGCAGAYNIEAQVAHVTLDECYQNVAGLPLCHLYAALRTGAAASCETAAKPSPPVAPCDASLGRCCQLGPRLVSAADAAADATPHARAR